MIAIRKLKSLPRATRLRRIVKILEEIVRERQAPEAQFLASLWGVIGDDLSDNKAIGSALSAIADAAGLPVDDLELVRRIDDLRHVLMHSVGLSVGDWDLLEPAGYTTLASNPPCRQTNDAGLSPVGIYVDSIRSPFNLGSIVRSAAAFGVKHIGLSPETVSPDHPRAIRSAMGSFCHVNSFVGGLDEYVARHFDGAVAVIALETDGTDIDSFKFPKTGVLVVGSEELGIRPTVRALATECVCIPMPGEKRSLNVGIACAIALHSWLHAITR